MDSTTPLSYQNPPAATPTVSPIILIIYLAVIALMIVAVWKVFTKAGKPGWAAIVPIYNTIVMLQIAERPVWWVLLFLVPVLNIVIAFIVYIDIASKFGRSTLFGVFGLTLFPFVGWPMLAFGNAQYQGAGAPPAGPTDPGMPAPPAA